MAHLGRALDHRVEGAERGHDLAGGKTWTVRRPSDMAVIRSASRCAPTPRPGKFRGQVVTIRQVGALLGDGGRGEAGAAAPTPRRR